MNFIFISPNFPHTYWNFCDRLRRNGVNVLGIGDADYDGLEEGLRGALTEYYKVDSLENYDQVFRAVANILGVREGKMNMDVTNETVLHAGQQMLVLGRYEDLRRIFFRQ